MQKEAAHSWIKSTNAAASFTYYVVKFLLNLLFLSGPGQTKVVDFSCQRFPIPARAGFLWSCRLHKSKIYFFRCDAAAVGGLSGEKEPGRHNFACKKRRADFL